MHIECLVSPVGSNLHCSVCGQGVLISPSEKGAGFMKLAKKLVAEHLRSQHEVAAHHGKRFLLGELEGLRNDTPVIGAEMIPTFAF